MTKHVFFYGYTCPEDNLQGILSIDLKLGKYIHSNKIWKTSDFDIDWLRNGPVINESLITKFPNSGKHKNTYILKIARDKVISKKFLTHWALCSVAMPILTKIFVSLKWWPF